MEFKFVLAAICLAGLICLGECHKKRNQTADSDEYQTLFDSIQQKVQFPEHHKSKNSGSDSRASSGSDSDDRDNNGDMFQIFTQVSGSLVPSTCQADTDCAASDMVCSRFLGKCVSPASKSQNGTKALTACGAQVCSNDSDCCAGQVCDSYNGLLSVNRCRQGDAGQGSVSVSVNGAKAALKPQKNSGKAASSSSSADASSSSSAERQTAQIPDQADSAAQQPAVAVSYAKSAKAQAPVRTAQPAAQVHDGSDVDNAPAPEEVHTPVKPVKAVPAASGLGGTVGVKSAGKSRGRVQQQSYANAQPDESDAEQQPSSPPSKPAGPPSVPVVSPPHVQAAAGNSDDNAAQQDNSASAAAAPAVIQTKQSAKSSQKQMAQNSAGRQPLASGSLDAAEEGSGAAASDNQEASAASQQPQVPVTPSQAASGDMSMGNNDVQMQTAESVGQDAQAASLVRAASGQNAAPLRTKSKSAPAVDASNTDNAAAASSAADNGQDEQIQLSMFQTNGAAPPKVLLSSKTGFQRKSSKGKAKEAPTADAQTQDAAPSVVPPGVPGRYRK